MNSLTSVSANDLNLVESSLRDKLLVMDLMVTFAESSVSNALRLLCSTLELRDAFKRKADVATLLRVTYMSYLAVGAPHQVVALDPVVTEQLGGFVRADTNKQPLDGARVHAAVVALHTEVIKLLAPDVLVALRGKDRAARQDARVNALLRCQDNVGDEERKKDLRARAVAAKASLAAGAAPKLAEFRAAWKALVPLSVVYHEPQEDLRVLFERMRALFPLSAETLRRRAFLAGFLATHRKHIAAEEIAALEAALAQFGKASAGAPPSVQKFSHAVEAFAHGRSHNPQIVSVPNLEDVLSGLALYDCLKFDAAWRDELLEVEHAFESSKLLAPTDAKIYWYWALFLAWTATALNDAGKAAEAKTFFVASCDKCFEALALQPSYLRPLVLAGVALLGALDKSKGGASPAPPPSAKHVLRKYLSVFAAHAKASPYDTTFGALAALLGVGAADGGDPESVLKLLYDICATGENRTLRLQALAVLLQADQEGKATQLAALQSVYRAVDIGVRDALAHQDAFLALMTYFPRTAAAAHNNDLLGVNKEKAAETVSPRTIKKIFKFRSSANKKGGGAAQPAPAARNKDPEEPPKPPRRKGSIWVLDPTARFESELREADPKKEYTLMGELGAGGFASVIMARRKADGLQVAIKVINKPVSQAAMQILAEVQVMRMCKFVYIVPLLDALYWKDASYLVMGYSDGGSLDKLIETVKLNDAQRAHVFVRVCKALAYLEGLSLVHRDVKPANILLSRGGAIRLGDLGLMKPQAEVQYRRSTAGTPHFRAPEVLLGFGATCKSDVYSFGCALYTAATGKPPHQGLSPARLLWEVTTTTAGLPTFKQPRASSNKHPATSAASAGPSEVLTALMLRCFTLDPTQRASARDLLTDPFFQLDSMEATKSIEHLCSITFLDDALGQVGFNI